MRKLVKIYNERRTVTMIGLVNSLYEGLCHFHEKAAEVTYPLHQYKIHVCISYGYLEDKCGWFGNMSIINDSTMCVYATPLLELTINSEKSIRQHLGAYEKIWNKFFFKNKKSININVINIEVGEDYER